MEGKVPAVLLVLAAKSAPALLQLSKRTQNYQDKDNIDACSQLLMHACWQATCPCMPPAAPADNGTYACKGRGSQKLYHQAHNTSLPSLTMF